MTAVDKLFITVGVKASLASSDFKKCGGTNYTLPFPGEHEKDGKMVGNEVELFNTFKGALGASYQILDNLKVSASYAILLFHQPEGVDIDPMMQFGVGVDVGLTDTLGLSADFRAVLPANELDPVFSSIFFHF